MAKAAQPHLFTMGGTPVRRMRREADRTIKALRDGGRLEGVDQLLVALIRTTADVADEHRANPDAAYHLNAALRLLADLDSRLRTLGGPEVDDFAALLELASGTAPPRDSP